MILQLFAEGRKTKQKKKKKERKKVKEEEKKTEKKTKRESVRFGDHNNIVLKLSSCISLLKEMTQ